jgi:transcriptional regulator with XRE-family HTH domain
MATAAHVGSIIREARQRLNLTEEQCARKCGLSLWSYGDVEARGGEFFSNISLGTARRICNFLGLDLLDLTARFLGLEISNRLPVDDESYYSRNQLIAYTRSKRGMTQENLADSIGFGTVTVEFLERTPDFIESLPLKVVVELARSLELDPGLLLCAWP